MGDDFLRLVSQANPAAREYQPTNNGYPPSSSSSPYMDNNPSSNPQLLDPFFDDDDEPDSAFGRPMPMQSQESGLPFARAGATPAGAGQSKTSFGDGAPQGWNFDDDDPRQGPSSADAAFPGPSKETPKSGKRKRKWKWPWQKEQQLTGERVIALNNRDANSEFGNNFVSTSKYNLVTFMPKFLLGAYWHCPGVATAHVSQNNSQNTPISSFYSRHAYNRFLTYLPPTSTPQSSLWLLSWLHPHSKRFKRIWCAVSTLVSAFANPPTRNDTSLIRN